MTKKPDMEDTIAKIRANINKNRGGKVAIDLSKEDLLQVDSWINMPDWFTGVTGFGNGLPCGHLTQLIGDSDSGKTSILIQMMVACQQQGGICFMIDSEHKFSVDRFRSMGGDVNSLIPLTSDTLETAWDNFSEIITQVKEIRKTSPDMPIMIVWDSIAASIPDSIAEADAGDHHVAVQAKVNNKEVLKFRADIRKYNIAAVLVNHSYMTMPTWGIAKEVVKGGNELYYQSTLILKTQRISWETRERNSRKEIVGIVTKLKPFKCHLSDKKAEVTLYMVGKTVTEDKEKAKEAVKNLDKETE
jgi:RecA/RadA recombinase